MKTFFLWLFATLLTSSALAAPNFTFTSHERAHTPSGHCVDLVVSNHGNEAGVWSIHWELDAQQQITEFWNIHLQQQPGSASIHATPKEEVVHWGGSSYVLNPGESTPAQQFGYCVTYLVDQHETTPDNQNFLSNLHSIETITDDWEDGHCVDLQVTNQGSSSGIWSADISIPDDHAIYTSWNIHTQPQLYEKKIKVTPLVFVASWGTDYHLQPGDTAGPGKFGYCVEKKKITTTTSVSDVSEDGYCASLTIKNISDDYISNWSTQLKTYGTLSLASNFNYTEEENGFATIQGTVANSDLAPGESVIGNFCAINLINHAGNPISGTEWDPRPASNGRNLFVEFGVVDHPMLVEEKLQSLYREVFLGQLVQPYCVDSNPGGESNPETDSFVCEGPSSYIWDHSANTIKSEGMSYGMMVALMMDDRATFDALWYFSQDQMQGRNPRYPQYFSWQLYARNHTHQYQPTNPGGGNPASDGEEYIVTALLLAQKKWGHLITTVDYYQEAQDIAVAMVTGPDPMFVYVDDTYSDRMIVISPIGDSATRTDPSYHLPAFYKLWANVFGPSNDYFGSVLEDITHTSRQFLINTAALSPVGLFPEYSEFTGEVLNSVSVGGAGANHDDFFYDSWRVIQNLAVDYHWVSQDPAVKATVIKMLEFFNSQRGSNGRYAQGYRLDGSVLESSPSNALIAMNAVGALVVDASDPTDPEYILAKQFVQDLWDINSFNLRADYYSQVLYLLGMLHASGKFELDYEPGI